MTHARILFIATALLAGCAADTGSDDPLLGGPDLSKADGFDDIDRAEIQFGQPATGEFTEDFEYFAYEFGAREDAVITAEVTQRGSARDLDTVLWLYRTPAEGAPARIAADDDAGWGALSRIEEFRLYTDDRYVLVVGTAAAQGRGNFRIALTCESGDCEQEHPPCAEPLRREGLECLEEIAADWDYDGELSEAAQECIAGGGVTGSVEDHCLVSDPPAYCEAGFSVVRSACEGFLRDSFPSARGLSPRLELVGETETDLIEDAAHDSSDCSAGEDAGCQLVARAYRYDGAVPSMAEVLAHARTLSPAGPGTTADLSLERDGAALRSFAGTFDAATTEAVENAATAIGLDIDAADVATATSVREFQWSHGDCQSDMVVARDADAGLILTLVTLFCYG